MTMKINFSYLPIKIHFLIFFAALSGVLPYLQLLIKQAGISATGSGIIFAAIPFTITVIKPLFGLLVDKSHRLVLILELLLLTFVVSYTITNYIPAIQNQTIYDVGASCDNNRTQLVLTESCQETHSFTCQLNCQICNSTVCKYENFSSELSFVDSSTLIYNENICQSSQIDHCKIECPTEFCSVVNVFHTHQYWLFFFLMLAGGVSSDIVISLSDAACYELLQTESSQYGKQRLWGTIGWGLFSPIIGSLVDMVSEGMPSVNYSPAFYAMIVGILIDSLIVWNLPVTMKNTSTNMLQDIGTIFSNIHIDAFISAVFFAGVLTAFQWNYIFWYLEGLNASKLLLGLMMTVECFATEAPIMFFAGWIIDKIGHEVSVLMAFVFFCIRYIGTSYVTDPWYMLIIAICHGVTFGLFYAAMTSFAKRYSPPGTEATLQCLLGGAFSGLGIGVGSLIAGIVFDNIGGKLAYRYAGIAAGIAFCLYAIIFFYTSKINSKNKNEEGNSIRFSISSLKYESCTND